MDGAPHTIPVLRCWSSWRTGREFLTVAEAPYERHRKGTQRPGWVPLATSQLIPGALGATAKPGKPPAAPSFRPL